MSKLVQLAEMREKGVLSEEEFIMAKSKLRNYNNIISVPNQIMSWMTLPEK